MTRLLFLNALFLLPATVFPGPAPQERPAEIAWRLAFLKGDYARALEALQEQFLNADDPSGKSLLALTEVQLELGKYQEARGACERFLGKHPESVPARERLGEILLATGKYADSAAQFRKALKYAPDSLKTSFNLLLAVKALGKQSEAKELLGRLVASYYDKKSLSPEECLQYGSVFHAANKPHLALSLFTKAEKKMPGATEPLLAQGFLFLDKGQINDAALEFRAVLKRNPKHPAALVGMARCYYLDGDYPRVLESCEAARRTNPNQTEALELLAALSVHEEDYQQAEKYLQQALEVNPNDLSVRTQLASAYYLSRDQGAYEKEKERVFKVRPDYAAFYREIGDAAERLRRPEVARSFFEKATQLGPGDWRNLESLGFLYCREGREKEAYSILEKSFELNRFNRRVYNLLETLDYMDNFLTEENDYFRLKVHQKKDACLVDYAMQYLDWARTHYRERYKFKVIEKTLVEIFPRHDFFAARIHGLPGIGLNGVCFGKVILSDSPRIKPGAFNWRDILVHEYSHVVTLNATNFRIPRWFTEGLAVYDEGKPRSFRDDQLLVTAWRAGGLIPLGELNRGFTRPKNQFQIMLAYAQSEIAVEFIYEKYGREKILSMLEDLRQGLQLAQVVKKEFNQSLDQFSSAMLAYTSAQIRRLPLMPQFGPPHLGALQREAEQSPKDAAKQAEFALALLQSGKSGEAGKAASSAASLGPEQFLPHLVLGEIEFRNKKLDPARTYFEKAVELDGKWIWPYFRLAIIAKQQDRPKDGIKLLHQLIQRYSRFAPAYALLEDLATSTDDTKLRLDALEGLLRCPEGVVDAARKLLKVYDRVERFEDVERVAKVLFETHPYLAESHEMLARAYAAQNRPKSASREYLVCIQIQPKAIKYHLALARILLANGQNREAKEVLIKARRVQRKNPAVLELLKSVE